MAADAPFGLSFGNPAKYMGQSPLAEIGKAAKTGLILYGLQQSGAIEALDKLGVKPNAAGTFSYNNPATPTGAVPPVGVAAQPVVPNANVPMANAPTPAIATPFMTVRLLLCQQHLLPTLVLMFLMGNLMVLKLHL
jgi:hypothetical protein